MTSDGTFKGYPGNKRKSMCVLNAPAVVLTNELKHVERDQTYLFKCHCCFYLLGQMGTVRVDAYCEDIGRERLLLNTASRRACFQSYVYFPVLYI